MTILVTGNAGFIGYHLTKRLIELDIPVIGIDNLNDYYDPKLKLARLKNLTELAKEKNNQFVHNNISLENKNAINEIFNKYKPEQVVNLAAQAGVRYSLENPSAYIQSNLVGFGNILEGCRELKVKQLIYASSSSVYGGNVVLPFTETQGVNHPVSLYAATKRANELMAHTYSHLYSLPTTGLRFFTVYGPWGRPDMALFLFTKAMFLGEPIEVFNGGKMSRDFTYIDDIIESMTRLINKPAIPLKNFDKTNPDASRSWCPYMIFNIGNSQPASLMTYIEAIEKATNKKAIKKYMPMQPGDVERTEANTESLEKWINFKPNTSIDDGVKKFVDWYREHY